MLALVLDCASPARIAPIDTPLETGTESQLSVASSQHLEVPFHAQASRQCGPASLAMVLNFTGIEGSPEKLAEQVYTTGRGGSLQTDLVASARRNGRIPYPIQDRRELLGELAAGRPVLVMQNLGFAWFPVWHFAVVVGYDLERAKIMLHSGRKRDYTIPLSLFERTWARSGHWARVVLRPGELPVRPETREVLESISAFERVNPPDVVATAYRSAIEQLPASPETWLALGNASYESGDLETSVRAFRRAAELPGAAAGPALNNLAHVLAERGELDEARRVLAEAIARQDRWHDTYLRTLQELESKRSAQ